MTTGMARFMGYLTKKCEAINLKCGRGPRIEHQRVRPVMEVANYVRLLSVIAQSWVLTSFLRKACFSFSGVAVNWRLEITAAGAVLLCRDVNSFYRAAF
jgi:hypothetical protein